jgi:hypothetical protein
MQAITLLARQNGATKLLVKKSVRIKSVKLGIKTIVDLTLLFLSNSDTLYPFLDARHLI